jgi:hypothetical protein
MKTIFSRRLISLSIITIVTICTMSRQKQADNKSALVRGYINTQNGACQLSDFCSTNGQQVCTVGDIIGGTRLWGKNANGLCILILYRPQP